MDQVCQLIERRSLWWILVLFKDLQLVTYFIIPSVTLMISSWNLFGFEFIAEFFFAWKSEKRLCFERKKNQKVLIRLISKGMNGLFIKDDLMYGHSHYKYDTIHMWKHIIQTILIYRYQDVQKFFGSKDFIVRRWGRLSLPWSTDFSTWLKRCLKCFSQLWINQFKHISWKIKKNASSVGIEPTTSRLTVERANRLRHEDLRPGR